MKSVLQVITAAHVCAPNAVVGLRQDLDSRSSRKSSPSISSSPGESRGQRSSGGTYNDKDSSEITNGEGSQPQNQNIMSHSGGLFGPEEYGLEKPKIHLNAEFTNRAKVRVS